MAETEKSQSLDELLKSKNKETSSTPAKSTPAKKAAPAKAASSARKEDDNKEETAKTDPKEDEDVTVPPVTTEQDVKDSLNANDDRVDPDEEDESDTAPGHGIISVKEHEEGDEETSDMPEDLGVLSRVQKMSPPGMTHLNTYSGGSDHVEHDHEDVIVKPLGLAENKAAREIVDETGKSRLLHPDVTKPAIPSEQAMVTTTTTTHVYATPIDPVDPNKHR